jgi:hypothetical protein
MRGAIHSITIHTPAGSTRDAEGTSHASWADQTVRGLASPLTDQEQWIAGQRGLTSNTAVHLPPGTSVAANCEVTVAGTHDLGLDGRYAVVEIGGFRTHQRVLLRAFETPERVTSQVAP